MLIIAFPFAGGNKYSYSFIKSHIGEGSRIITLEYPGRGKRISEPLLDNIPDIVNDSFAQIKELIRDEDYVIYGHSMGGLVSVLVCKMIEISSLPNPKRLVLSGCLPPFRIGIRNDLSLLSSEDFWNKIKEFDGTPSAFYDSLELREYFEPILRADIYSIRNYKHNRPLALQTNIKIFYGDKENFNPSDVDAWQGESLNLIDIKILEGNHFFIFDYGDVIAKSFEEEFVENSF